jgi:uncharacterized membrane protein
MCRMSDAEAVSKPRKPLFLTICGGLVVLVLLVLPFLAGDPGKRELPDWVRFIGHFHPVLLHLPIGVFVLILIQETWRIVRFKRPGGEGDSMFPLFFGVVSAILAVIAGFLLYHGHGEEYALEEDGIAERHLWSGLAFAALTVVVFVMKAWAVAAGSRGWWYRGLLFTSVGVMTFASHDGASMTHGEDYLTKYAPDPVRKVIGMEPKSEKKQMEDGPVDLVVYQDIVAPILERRCVQCHKPGKVKGKLRMDTYEMLLKGGSEGPALVAGNSAESLMVVRIQLPEDDDEHMPPEGKTDISPDELAVLKWWIDGGADPAKKLSEFKVPTDIADKLAALGAGVAKVEEGDGHGSAAAKGPDAALVKTVAGLAKEYPGAVAFESQSTAGVTFTAVSMRGKFDDAEFAKLASIVPHLVTADLSATKITDQTVAKLKSASHLRQLRLAETAVTDAAVETIVSLPALESLNLYGTALTDAGAEKLKAMKTLRSLYLWQTSVSPEMVETLRKALPECQIVTGA